MPALLRRFAVALAAGTALVPVASAFVVLVLAPRAAAAAENRAREDVRAEAASAAKAGEIPRGETAGQLPPPPVPASSARSRGEVKAETKAAVKAGAIEHGEAAEPKTPPAQSTRSRAEVRAEAASALKGGASQSVGRGQGAASATEAPARASAPAKP